MRRPGCHGGRHTVRRASRQAFIEGVREVSIQVGGQKRCTLESKQASSEAGRQDGKQADRQAER